MFKWLWGNLWPQLYIYIIENGRKKNIVIIKIFKKWLQVDGVDKPDLVL